MSKKPEVLSKRVVANSRLFAIEEVHLRFTNGQERHFERMRRRLRPAVLIVPVTEQGELLLIREYAAGIEDYVLGFPQGLADGDEDSLTAANRELQEEIGMAARELTRLTSLSTVPGYWGNFADVVLARDLYPSPLIGDEPEPLEVVPWLLKDYKSLLAHKDFNDARSVAALLLAKEMLL